MWTRRTAWRNGSSNSTATSQGSRSTSLSFYPTSWPPSSRSAPVGRLPPRRAAPSTPEVPAGRRRRRRENVRDHKVAGERRERQGDRGVVPALLDMRPSADKNLAQARQMHQVITPDSHSSRSAPVGDCRRGGWRRRPQKRRRRRRPQKPAARRPGRCAVAAELARGVGAGRGPRRRRRVHGGGTRGDRRVALCRRGGGGTGRSDRASAPGADARARPVR